MGRLPEAAFDFNPAMEQRSGEDHNCLKMPAAEASSSSRGVPVASHLKMKQSGRLGHTPSCLGTQQFACLPIAALMPRAQKHKDSANNCEVPEQRDHRFCELPVPLELTFVRVEFSEIGHWPWHELRITALEGIPSEDGLVALIEFMDFALGLQHATTGFILTYDVWELGQPQLDVVNRVLQWTCESDNAAKLRQLCFWWKVVVPDGARFQIARLLLNSVFYLYPPTCLTYLVTNTEGPPGTDAICYTPVNDEAEVLPFDLDSVGEELQKHDVLVANGEQSVWIDLGFAKVCHGYNADEGMGFIKIFAQRSEITDEGLTQMMSVLDEFVSSKSAAKGFAITYDVRSLCRIPPMQMVTRVAEWGNEPDRQQTWQRLNLACKVVVPGGIMFIMMKGLLATFFFLCPPVCRTYLMTDPDQSEEASTVFETGTNIRRSATPQEGCIAEVQAHPLQTVGEEPQAVAVQNQDVDEDPGTCVSEDPFDSELRVMICSGIV